MAGPGGRTRPFGRGADGLAGAAIPRLARVLAVTDVYDALSSARPYRPALPHAEGLAELRANAAGGGLDGELVRAFCDVVSGPSGVPPDAG